MNDFFQQALLPYNFPLTILMGLVALYWLLSLLGTVDMDFLDLDLDAEVDGDIDTEVSTGGNFIGTLLKVVNAQDVPLMMVLSILTLFWWLGSIISNYMLNPMEKLPLALGIGAGNFILSVVGVKLVTQPLRPFFRALKKEEAVVPLVGSIGTVKSRVMNAEFGQVSVPREKGAPALLNARLEKGELLRGDTVIILSYEEEKKCYLVKPAPELSTKNLAS